ncbi:MAG: hypothetical protein ABIF11_05905 [Nitrospirota bacterium]
MKKTLLAISIGMGLFLMVGSVDAEGTDTSSFSPMNAHAINLFLGPEYALSKEKFAKAFPLIGLNVQNRLSGGEQLDSSEKGKVNAWTFLGNFNLSSIVAQEEGTISGTAQQALDFNLGLLYEFWKFMPFIQNSPQGSHTVTLGLLVKGGGVNAEDVKADILWRWFVGLRLWTIQGKFDGAYIEVGTGESQNFSEKEMWRLKCSGFLPIYETEAKTKMFVSWFVDSDLGSGEDEMKVTLATVMDVEQIFDIFKFIKPE